MINNPFESPNRLKFRAWDKPGKKMVSMFHLFSATGKPCELIFGKMYPLVDCTGDDLILMQSTGLLDRNGKEIFEGDVVKDAGYGEGDIEYNDRFVIAFVSMINCVGFTAQRVGGGFCFEDILSAFHKIEIVGNIYEGSC